MDSRLSWTLVAVCLSTVIKTTGSDILCSFNESVNCDCVSISEGPADTSAVFNSTITLTCTVENVVGQEVQWTKGGVALGLDPSIPGYPRYSMADNSENTFAGRYDLSISLVQLEDEDHYQCQVTKCNVQSRVAFVTVLVPPYGPIIIDEEPNGEYRVLVDETISIKCEAWNAKPPAVVTWFAGNDQITEGVVDEVYPSKTALTNTSATITLTPSLSDDQKIYTCVMNNDALIAEDPSVIPAQKNDIHLVVLVPPLGPTIDGYDPSRGSIKVNEGDPITVTCRSENGKPAAELKWYKGNATVTENVDIEIEPPDEYGRQNVTAYLRLVVNASYDNIVFTCSSTNEALRQPNTISFILDVSTSLDPGIIAAIVAGAVLFLLIVIILILVFCKKRKAKEETANLQTTTQSVVQQAESQNAESSTNTSIFNATPSKKETELSTESSESESSEEGEINIAFETELEESVDEYYSPPPRYSAPSSEEDLKGLPPDGDVFSLSSSIRRSERGSPVDDFLQEDLEILSIPSQTNELRIVNTDHINQHYVAKTSPTRAMITTV